MRNLTTGVVFSILLLCRAAAAEPLSWLDEKTFGFELSDAGPDLTDIARSQNLVISEVWPTLDQPPIASGARVVLFNQTRTPTLDDWKRLLDLSKVGEQVRVTYVAANDEVKIVELPVRTRREIAKASVKLQQEPVGEGRTAKPGANVDCDDSESPFKLQFRVNERGTASSPILVLDLAVSRGQRIHRIYTTFSHRLGRKMPSASLELLDDAMTLDAMPQRQQTIAGTKDVEKLLELMSHSSKGTVNLVADRRENQTVLQVRLEVPGGYTDTCLTYRQRRALRVGLRAYEAFGGVWPD
jgi:hypothetical protein